MQRFFLKNIEVTNHLLVYYQISKNRINLVHLEFVCQPFTALAVVNPTM